jgi:hypothetical protein
VCVCEREGERERERDRGLQRGLQRIEQGDHWPVAENTRKKHHNKQTFSRQQSIL